MKAQFKLSPLTNSVFVDELPGDVLIYPNTSSQSILMGSIPGQHPMLALHSNAAVVGGPLTSEGGINTNLMQATGLFLTPYDPTHDPNSIGNTVAPMYIPMNSSGPFNNAASLGSGSQPADGGSLLMDIESDTNAVLHLANVATPTAVSVVFCYNGATVLPTSVVGLSGTLRFIEHATTARTVVLDPRMVPAPGVTAITATTPSFGSASIIDMQYTIVAENIITYSATVQSFASLTANGAMLINAASVTRTATNAAGVLHLACVSDDVMQAPQSVLDAQGNVIYVGASTTQTPAVYRYDQTNHLVDAITTDMPCDQSFMCLSESGTLLVAFAQNNTALATPTAANATYHVYCRTVNLATGTITTQTLLTTTSVVAGSTRPAFVVALNADLSLTWAAGKVIFVNNGGISDLFADRMASSVNLAGGYAYTDMVYLALSSGSLTPSALYLPNNTQTSDVAYTAGSSIVWAFSAANGVPRFNALMKGSTSTMDCRTVGAACNGCISLVARTGNATGLTMVLSGGMSHAVSTNVYGTGTSDEQRVILSLTATDTGAALAWSATILSRDQTLTNCGVGIDVDAGGNVYYALPYGTLTPIIRDSSDNTFAIPVHLAHSGVNSSAVAMFNNLGFVDWYINAPGALVGPKALAASSDNSGCIISAAVALNSSIVASSAGGGSTIVPSSASIATFKLGNVSGDVQWLVTADDSSTASTTTAMNVSCAKDGSLWVTSRAVGATIGSYTVIDTFGKTATYKNPMPGASTSSALCFMQRIDSAGSALSNPYVAATTPNPATTPSFVNRIINGAMQINEMGYSGLQVGGVYGNNGICAIDRWQVYRDAAAGYYTVDQVYSLTDLPSFPYSLRLTNSSSGSTPPTVQGLVQKLAGRDLSDMSWDSGTGRGATLSFWCKLMGSTAVNNSAGSVSLGIVVRDVARTAAYATLFSAPTSSSWKFVSVPLAAPAASVGSGWTANGMTIAFSFAGGAATDALPLGWSTVSATSAIGTVKGQGDMLTSVNGSAFYITGVQLQAGSPATSFEFRPDVLERSLNLNISSACNVPFMGSIVASNVATFASNVTMLGAVSISNAASFYGNLTTTGSTSLSNSVNVYGKLSASNTVSFGSDVSAFGPVSLSNIVNIYGTLSTSNTAAFASNLAVTGSAMFSNDTTFYGKLASSNVASFSSNLAVTGPATFSNDTTFYGKLTSSNVASFSSNLVVTGPATFSNDITMYGNLTSSNNVIFGSNLTVLGSFTAVTVNNSYSNVVIYTSEEIRSNLVVDGTFSTSNYATFSSNVTMMGAVSISNVASFTSNLIMMGAATLSNTVDIYGKLWASNIASFSSNISMSGPVSLSNAVSIYGALSASNTATFASNVWVTGPATLSNDTAVYGKFSASNLAYFMSNVNVGSLSSGNTIFVTGSNVGIGISNPIYPLQITTQFDGASVYASYDIVAYSDARVKTDLRIIPDALTKLDSINGYTFVRNDYAKGMEVAGRQCGLIAQELEQVLPEAVHVHPETGMLSIAYGNVVALLLQAIKELRAEVNAIRSSLP
jgi:predicted acyltransferase (DUF342 family)